MRCNAQIKQVDFTLDDADEVVGAFFAAPQTYNGSTLKASKHFGADLCSQSKGPPKETELCMTRRLYKPVTCSLLRVRFYRCSTRPKASVRNRLFAESSCRAIVFKVLLPKFRKKDSYKGAANLAAGHRVDMFEQQCQRCMA